MEGIQTAEPDYGAHVAPDRDSSPALLNDDDSVREYEGVRVIVDSGTLEYIRGVEIDFVDRGNGDASFVFNNAFALTGGSGTCGACGAAGGGSSAPTPTGHPAFAGRRSRWC